MLNVVELRLVLPHIPRSKERWCKGRETVPFPFHLRRVTTQRGRLLVDHVRTLVTVDLRIPSYRGVAIPAQPKAKGHWLGPSYVLSYLELAHRHVCGSGLATQPRGAQGRCYEWVTCEVVIHFGCHPYDSDGRRLAISRPRLADLSCILDIHGGFLWVSGRLSLFPKPQVTTSFTLSPRPSLPFFTSFPLLLYLKCVRPRRLRPLRAHTGAQAGLPNEVPTPLDSTALHRHVCPSEYDAYLRSLHGLGTTVAVSPFPRCLQALLAAAVAVDRPLPPRRPRVPVVGRNPAPPHEAGAVHAAARVDGLALDGLHPPLHAVPDHAAAGHPGAQAGLEPAGPGVPEEGHAAPRAEVAGLPLPAAHLVCSLCASRVQRWYLQGSVGCV